MAVNTPQLDAPVYQPQQMAQPPVPPPTEPSQVLPPQAGYVSKAGAASFVANGILNGWLRGRQAAQQRNIQKEQSTLQFWNNTVQQKVDIAKTLRETKGEQSPEYQSAYKDMMQAWQGSLQAQQKFVMPDDDGKKKSKGQKFEGVLGQVFGKSGLQPHDIPAAALKALSSGPPPGFTETLEDQQRKAQTKLAQTETGVAETQAEAEKLKLKQAQTDEDIKKIVATPAGERTLAQQQQLDGWQRIQHINDPESQKLADMLFQNYITKGLKVPDQYHDFAMLNKMIPDDRPQLFNTTEGLNQYITAMSPDGKVLSKTEVGRQFHEDEASEAARSAQFLWQAQHGLIDQAVPVQAGEISDADFKKIKNPSPDQLAAHKLRAQRIDGFVAAENTKNPLLVSNFISESPVQAAQDRDAVSKAIWQVAQQGADPQDNKEDKTAWMGEMKNFILFGAENSNPNNPDASSMGLNVFRNEVAGPTGHSGWFGFGDPTYQGGIQGQEKLAAVGNAIRNRIRQQLQLSNKKLTEQDLDRMVPMVSPSNPAVPMSATPGGASMNPTPGSGHVYGTPGGANKKYMVTTTDGATSTVYTTPDTAQQLQQQGATVTESQ